MLRKKSLLFAMLLGIFVVAGCSQEPAISETEEGEEIKKVKVAEVETKRMGEEILVDAQLLPAKDSELFAEIDGEIIQKMADVGQKVEKGQRLLQLKNEEISVAYDKAVLASEKARVELQKARAEREILIQQANEELQKAKLQLEVAKRNYEQTNVLYEQNAVSEKEWQQAKDELEKAKIDHMLAEKNLEKTELDHHLHQLEIQAQEAAVAEREAAIQREKTVITAPFSGVVVEMNGEIGENVSARQTVVRLEQHNPLYVRAFVTESDLSHIEAREKIPVYLPLMGQKKDAEVMYVSPSKAEDEDGFAVKLSLPNEDNSLRPGMGVHLVVSDEQVREVIAVPVSAVRQENEQSFVFVISDNRAERREVQVGRKTDEFIEITDGLNTGEKIVIIGQSQLNDGDKIEIVE